jgi:hypothetical protein
VARPDGRIVVRCHVWSVRADAPAHEHVDDFYDDDAEHLAEKFILELGERYKIREVVADPNYFGTELRRLGRRFTTAPLFPQSKEMTEYVQEFYRLVEAARRSRTTATGSSRCTSPRSRARRLERLLADPQARPRRTRWTPAPRRSSPSAARTPRRNARSRGRRAGSAPIDEASS